MQVPIATPSTMSTRIGGAIGLPGPDAGLYALLQSMFPFFSLLRASVRFGLLVTLAAAVLGGLGAATLERRLRPLGRNVWAAFGTALVGMAIGGSYVGELFLTPAPALTAADQRLIALPSGPVVVYGWPAWAAISR